MDSQAWGEQEFLGAAVEDHRQARSLARMAARLLEHPELAFSSACGTALRKAAWRIFSQEEVDVQWGHQRQTARRCQDQQGLVLVSQDTTDLNFDTHTATQGLGHLGGRGRGGQGVGGVCVHSALALSEQGAPLGLLGQHIWAPKAQHRTSAALSRLPLQEKESARWVEALDWVGQYLAQVPQVLVIADREADFYEYFAHPRPANVNLLVRVHHLHRKVCCQGQLLPLGQATVPEVAHTWVTVREGAKKRSVEVRVQAGPLECPPSQGRCGPNLPLGLIIARAVEGPQLEWYLLTTQAVETAQQACRMLAYYRQRWCIERLHLILKSGLGVEQLQFDTLLRLKNAIQMYSAVAWQLLWLKELAAEDPSPPVEEYFTAEQVTVLQAQASKPLNTVRQALVVLAGLAGFTPSKKQPLPGEKTTWQGWCIFLQLCRGYHLAFQKSYGTG
jgi:hypothetical protein